MKIAFDGQMLLEENKTGIAWNAHNLVLELAKYPENECTIQCFTFRCTDRQVRSLQEYREAGCAVECCGWFRAAWYRLAWLAVPLPRRLFFRAEPDIAQFFNYVVPPAVLGRRVTVIHDMAYKSCPHTVSRKTKIWLELAMGKTCRHVDQIVTVSEFSKKEIMKYMRIPKGRISVVPNAVDHARYHPNYAKGQIQAVLERLGIRKDYFLYLGTIEPRKNLERLIGAYERLCRQKKEAPQLVLAGKRGWLCRGIYEKAKSSGLGDRILFTGYVGQEDSPALMCGAKAFLFPSLYEGFGMPVLEAMACGTPVITSNTTSLPEVVGDAGVMVNPESEKEICRAMRRLLEDGEYRGECIRRGLERAQKYTWRKSAEKLMEIYQKLIET